MSDVHVCAPQAFAYRRVTYCPTCEQRRRMHVEMFEWYGTLVGCLTCGDMWSDGERLPRPFRRNWRPDAVRLLRLRPYTTKNEALQRLIDAVEATS